jgi:hypothetical protein
MLKKEVNQLIIRLLTYMNKKKRKRERKKTRERERERERGRREKLIC